MLKHSRKFLALAFFALAISLFALAGAHSPSYQKCAAEHESYNAKHERTDLNPPILRSPHLSLFLLCEGAFIDENNGTLTAIATIAIAAFTLTLWLATTRQAELTRAAIDLGNREFIATHRPRIIVRGFETLVSGLAEERVSVMFFYVNIGDSDAIVTEIGTVVTLGDLRAGVIFDKTEIKGVTLTSGEKEVFHLESDKFYFARLLDEVSAGTAADTAHLIGYVKYQDTLGHQRETGFCRLFHRDGRRWLRIENPEYEYQD